ncbi:hypothetical protein [Ferrimonas sp. YFM]|uniref:hypothetical protein n=1 Tax=Ferrimonas sp. YFM TaxID=3028878 RepID=UPI0025727EE9|nr:hypothetical protein [Ferrimonas sp. YFM]BDY03430.1 hypothetical protein F0521_04710 [Ferrimonas sp. YFM]
MLKRYCLVLAITLLTGCASFHDHCVYCDSPDANETERQALWSQLRADRERALASQPRSHTCSHNRCGGVSDCPHP